MILVVGLAWLIGGRDRELSRTLEATVSVPNVGLAVAIAHAAGAPQILVSTIAAIFLVRLIANQLLVRALGRVSRSLTLRPRGKPGGAEDARPAS